MHYMEYMKFIVTTFIFFLLVKVSVILCHLVKCCRDCGNNLKLQMNVLRILKLLFVPDFVTVNLLLLFCAFIWALYDLSLLYFLAPVGLLIPAYILRSTWKRIFVNVVYCPTCSWKKRNQHNQRACVTHDKVM